jgi:hypothetical protein
MTRQGELSRGSKSIAGAALVGLGLFVLSGNLDVTAAQLRCPLGTTAMQALWLVPSVFLAAASQTLLFQGFVQLLVSFWLLLFVIAAAILLRGSSRAKSEYFPNPANTRENRDTEHVDLAAPRSTLE